MTTRTRSVADLEVIATMDKEIERLRREMAIEQQTLATSRRNASYLSARAQSAVQSIVVLMRELNPLRAEVDARRAKYQCVESARQMLDKRVASLRFAEEQAGRMSRENQRLQSLLDAARELMRQPKTKKAAARKPKPKTRKKGTR